jgi:hypothetical protein
MHTLSEPLRLLGPPLLLLLQVDDEAVWRMDGHTRPQRVHSRLLHRQR